MNNTDLIEQFVEDNPNRPGPMNALVRGFAVPVAALVAYWEAVRGDIVKVADDYRLPVEAVRAAMAYYEQHKQCIDAGMKANAG